MGVLEGRVAFVTGAASGLGEAMARRFAQEGARVALADVQAEEAGRVAREIVASGGQALALACDVADEQSVQAAVDGAASRWGRLDIVCANAGINGVFAPVDELRPSEWARTLDVNLTGTFLTVHFAVPHLKAAGGGSIIVTSSINGNRNFAYAGASAYCTSKAAQVTFTKAIALELGRHSIRCNAICPGFVPSGIHNSTVSRNTDSLKLDVLLPHGSPALHAGCGTTDDVANAALFLASEQSSHISGVEIYVDGGASLL